MNDELFTINEVSKMIKVSICTINRWTRGGDFPKPVKIARSTRWRKSDIDNFISGGWCSTNSTNT